MPENIVPPLYLLQTNFGFTLSNILRRDALCSSSQSDSLINRLLAEGLMGLQPDLLLGNRSYYDHILTILNERLASNSESDLYGKDEAHKNLNEELEEDDIEDDLENSSDSGRERTDDNLLFDSNNTLSIRNVKRPSAADPISSILAQSLNQKFSSYPLPTRWLAGNQSQKKLMVNSSTAPEELKNKEEFVRLAHNGLVINAVSANGFGANVHKRSSTFLLKSNNCIPSEAGIFYYEIKINTNIKNYNLSLGYAKSSSVHIGKAEPSEVNAKIAFSDLPGVAEFTYGYNGQKASVSYFNRSDKSYGFTFGHNDTIGCGINFYDKAIFYTKNGQYLGVAFDNVDCKYVVPVIGFNSVYDEAQDKVTASSVQSLTNNAYGSLSHTNFGRLSGANINNSSANFQSFADSFDQFNNNHVLHEIVTNFGYSIKPSDGKGSQEGVQSMSGNFYFDINGYISGLKAKLFTKINKTNLELSKNNESSISVEAHTQKKPVVTQFNGTVKNLSISSLLNADKSQSADKSETTDKGEQTEIDPKLFKDWQSEHVFGSDSGDSLISTNIDRMSSQNKLVLKDVECKAVINNLIKNYFDHLGYINSKKAFANDLEVENNIMASNSETADKRQKENLVVKEFTTADETKKEFNKVAPENSDDSIYKQEIRNFILHDDINSLLEFLQKNYNEFFNISDIDYTADYSAALHAASLKNSVEKRTQDKAAEVLVFELQCLKLIKLIRNCVRSEKFSNKHLDEAIDLAKFLIKQYKTSRYKVGLLNDLFKLLISPSSSQSSAGKTHVFNHTSNIIAEDSGEEAEDVPAELLGFNKTATNAEVDDDDLIEVEVGDDDDDDDSEIDLDPILSSADIYDDGEQGYESRYHRSSEGTEKNKRSFEYLLRAKNYKNLKLRIIDRLNSFILRKEGKSSISDLEKVVNLTSYYLKTMTEKQLSDDVLFINLQKDILK